MSIMTFFRFEHPAPAVTLPSLHLILHRTGYSGPHDHHRQSGAA